MSFSKALSDERISPAGITQHLYAPLPKNFGPLDMTSPLSLAMEGYRHPPFLSVEARLTETVRGDKDWTQFVHARVEGGKDTFMAHPVKQESRLQSMARKDALIVIPEGCEALPRGEVIPVQLLGPLSARLGIYPRRQKQDK